MLKAAPRMRTVNLILGHLPSDLGVVHVLVNNTPDLVFLGLTDVTGVHFAETSIMLSMASILSKFIIALPPGKPRPEIRFTTGITRFVHRLLHVHRFDKASSHIESFDIKITPRLCV